MNNMKKQYMMPFTEIIIVNGGNLLEDPWGSVILDGNLPGGDTIGDGGDGDEDDEQLSKKSFWSDDE